MRLAQADAIIEGTLRRARELGAAPLAVAVLDAGGHVVVLKREDGAGVLRADIAVAKGYGAVGMGMSSRAIAERAERQPVFFGSLGAVTGGRLAPAAGGVLVRDADGTLLGAVGVSGDVSDMDERCAVHGVQEAGLVSEPDAADG